MSRCSGETYRPSGGGRRWRSAGREAKCVLDSMRRGVAMSGEAGIVGISASITQMAAAAAAQQMRHASWRYHQYASRNGNRTGSEAARAGMVMLVAAKRGNAIINGTKME